MVEPTDAHPAPPSLLQVTLVLGTSTGGVGKHVSSLVARLPRHGVGPRVLGPAATDALFGFSAAGVPFLAVEITPALQPVADVRAVRRLRRLLRGADAVHAHGLRAAAFAGLALGPRRAGRVPLVATWHNAVLGEGPRRALLTALERVAARSADVTLGASLDLVERARDLGAADARPGPVAAAPLPPPARDRAAVRAELGAGPRPVVLAVGRLAPQKDYGTLLTAAAAWRDRVVAPLVVIAGDGPLQGDLVARVEAEHLPVRLLGRRSDVADLMAAADVAVLSSTWEARALVAQEALRAGTPLVATAVGGVPELVGEAAVLVPAGDADALAREVGRLLDDPAARSALSARGARRAREWPDEDDTAAQVAAVYAEVARRPRR